VIDASVPVTGWIRQSPTRWVASVPELTLPPINLSPGAICIDRTTHCAYPDDVFSGERRMTRVWSLTEQGAGSYFVDYAARMIYVGVDPAGAPISRAVPFPNVAPWGGSRVIRALPGDTIENLTIEKCGVGLQGAAILGYEVTVKNVDVHLCHGRGIGVDDLSSVTDSRTYSNGQAGIGLGLRTKGASGPGGLVANNQVYGNGWSLCGMCGGIKGSTVRGVTIENNNVDNNYGNGIWMDNDSINYTIQDNLIRDNSTAGIDLEISYDGVVQRNTILGSGVHPVGPNKVGAIHVLASGACSLNCPVGPGSGIVIINNIIGSTSDPNAYGIILREQARGSGLYGAHDVRDVSVTGNFVTLCGTQMGPIASTFNGADTSVDNSIYASNNAFAGNQYTISSTALSPFRWLAATGAGTGWLTFSQWQQAGNDTTGSLTPANC